MAVLPSCPKCGEKCPPGALYCPRDGAELAHEGFSLAGRTLLDRFLVGNLIGLGAMASVYEARRVNTSDPADRHAPASVAAAPTEQAERVAVKLLRPKFGHDPELRQRFLQEAELASHLVHPGVVKIFEVGLLAATSSHLELPFIVMEFVAGVSLESALNTSGGSFSVEQTVRVVASIADAVGAAHALQIVHRDLKPSNIMLTGPALTEHVTVLDFGLARSGARASTLTRKGAIYGTPEYISPEGARGEAVDARSDVYALATILYRCLSGKPPFSAASPMRTLLEQVGQPAPELLTTASGTPLPKTLTAFVARNLAKDASQRCRDAREFRSALLSSLEPTAA